MRKLLDRGGVLLTANARAARALHLRYAENRQSEDAIAWPTPQILDLHSWLTEQWHSLLMTGTEDRLLLSDIQEQTLWERLIAPKIEKLSPGEHTVYFETQTKGKFRGKDVITTIYSAPLRITVK